MSHDRPDILLVEDSVDDSAFMTHALQAGGITTRVAVARDGALALAALFGEGNPARDVPRIWPRLIVLDLKLPKVDGLEILRRLKENPHTRAIPVVVLSSSLEKRDLAASYLLGVNGYLVKPMDFDEFTETVRMLGRYWLQFNQTVR